MYLPKVIAFNAKEPEAKKRYGFAYGMTGTPVSYTHLHGMGQTQQLGYAVLAPGGGAYLVQQCAGHHGAAAAGQVPVSYTHL